MRMKLMYKLFLPLVCSGLLFGFIGYYIMHGKLFELKDSFIMDMSDSTRKEVDSEIELLSMQALEKAAMFTQLPQVIEAYEIAHQGDINDAESPQSQEARELLRSSLATTLLGFQKQSGQKLRLHFHLPNGRSLARMWREKQSKKDGVWVDISDDISSFRKTVMEVNTKGIALQGIELGRGGFVIRGLVPVKSQHGKQLGSVEVLIDFNPILASIGKSEHEDVALYMNSSFLPITTMLRDPKKNPPLGDDFITIAAPRNEKIGEHIIPPFLQKSMKELTVTYSGNYVLAGFPVNDYQGEPIGVIVHARDIEAENSLTSSLNMIVSWVLLLTLGLSLIIGLIMLVINVTRPTRRILDRINDIADDRANLNESLPVNSSDEIGELCQGFNRLMDKLRTIICNTETYMNMVNAVPEAIFAVDMDMNIIAANDQALRMFDTTREKIMGTQCSTLFNTPYCGTDDCPVACSKKTGMKHESPVLEFNIRGETRYLRPYSDALMDCNGNRVGFFELAQDVTDVVVSERTMQSNMERMNKVSENIMAAANQIAQASESAASQVIMAREGADRQSERAASTATAMEEMNVTIMEVARNAASSAEQGDAAMKRAHQGLEVVERSIQAIGEVESLSVRLKDDISDLGTRVEAIGRIMDVIQDIADQTNLLALNAAIEAARAGEAGRGFAVVADEVRKLAEKTMGATKEVGQAILAIQEGASRNIQGMDEAALAVQNTTALARESGETLREIVGMVVSTVEQIQSIATAAEQQSATSEEINRSVEEVSSISSETAQAMGELSQSLEELEDLATRLRSLA